jgi:hypothetical protein
LVTMPVNGLIGIILVRWHSLASSFAAHSAFVAFWAVRTGVWAVFGARRSPLTFFGRLADIHSLNDPLFKECWTVTNG